MKILFAAAIISVIVISGCVQQPVAQSPSAPAPENKVQEPVAAPQKTVEEPAAEPVIERTSPNITDKRPDLSLTGITWDPKLPLVNELVTFTATVKNTGYSNVDSFSFTLSPLTDQASIISAASAQSPSLGPGDMTTIRMQAKIATPGPAKIKSTIDTFNKINEINESNNQLILPFRVYTRQSWAGCSGNGKSVCSDMVDASYFENHAECKPAYNCTSFVTSCDAICPFPR